MCMFCAAIPATVAAGAAVNVRQARQHRETEEAGVTPKKEIPVKVITGVALVALVTASVITHSRMNP